MTRAFVLSVAFHDFKRGCKGWRHSRLLNNLVSEFCWLAAIRKCFAASLFVEGRVGCTGLNSLLWHQSNFDLSGGQQRQNQRGRGQGGGRGNQMGTRGRGQTYGGGQNNTRGGMQGGRGRGNQHGTPYNYNQQQSGSYRGRGRARGRGGNNQNQSWNQNFSSYNNAPNQTFVDSSYGGENDGYQWDNSVQGGG